jgi:hypothetical protein
MRLRCGRREEVRVNDFNIPRLLIIGIGTGVGGCTYTQSGVGVERVGEMGENRGGKVRRWTDVPLHKYPTQHQYTHITLDPSTP